MTSSNQLTYYDYWLTKEVWPAVFAINIVFDYFKFGRLYDKCDDYDHVRDNFKNELENKMGHEDAKHMFSKRAFAANEYDEHGDWIEGKLNVLNSDVRPNKYITWLHSKGYEMPYEFKVFIGLEEGIELINEKTQQKIDKAVCQGIARTLWSIYPEMIIDNMQYEKSIQVYGSGKLYSTDTTLRRWLSEVDPRKVKTGPKKKI